MPEANTDRYVTFCNIDCDANAEKLMQHLKQRVAEPTDDQERTKWHNYFAGKFEQQAKMNHDDLFFVGSQMNSLYAYFELIEDDDAHDLLYQIEQECC